MSIEGAGIETGAHDVDAVEPGLGRDFPGIARKRQVVVRHHDIEVFFHLAAVGFAAHPTVDLLNAAESGALAPHDFGDAPKDRFGGLKKVFALARAPRPDAD